MREYLEAALYALSRGNVEEATQHVRAALAMTDPPPVEPSPAEPSPAPSE